MPNRRDVYVPADQTGYTGYNADRDRGIQIVLKADNSVNIAPSFYYPYAIPGSRGADDYSWNIANCNTTMMGFGDLLTAEPGNMTGPTRQGVDELVAREPWIRDARVLVAMLAHQAPGRKVCMLPHVVVELRPRIGRRERDLDAVGIQLFRECDRLLDGLLRLPWQTNDEGAMDHDAELLAALRELPRLSEVGALLDIFQNLLVPGFVAHDQQPESPFPHRFQRVVVRCHLRIGRPGEAKLLEAAG